MRDHRTERLLDREREPRAAHGSLIAPASRTVTRVDLLSFEGPDPYARAGGVASRVVGLAEALAARGLATSLWFVGDPAAAPKERRNAVELRRWCQWISAHHPAGVYDGEEGKRDDYARSLPPVLARELAAHVRGGGRALVLAEEWHTVHAVMHLDHLLRREGVRDAVTILWNANNLFGLERVDWRALAAAARLTTVSRAMRERLFALGVHDVGVVPNGLGDDAFAPASASVLRALRVAMRGRLVLAKMARWDPDKDWLGAIDAVALLRARGRSPLLVARGGLEDHGREVLARAASHELRVVHAELPTSGAAAMAEVLADRDDVDVLVVTSPIDAAARRVLLQAADAVLCQSRFEPFGLVGLETMAAGGLAVTGCTGEDYARPGHNALVIDRSDPRELAACLEHAVASPALVASLRRAGRVTAREHAWSRVVERALLPRAR